MSALCPMKKATGEIANRVQRVGINLTSTQKAVKINRITTMINYKLV